jgi:hypothetical protein
VPAPKPRRTTKPGTALRKEAAKLWEALTPPQVEARLAIVTLFATRGQISDIGAVDQDDDAYRISNALGEILEGKVSIDVDLEAGAGTLTVAGKALRFLANADGEWEHIPAPHLVAEEDEGS